MDVPRFWGCLNSWHGTEAMPSPRMQGAQFALMAQEMFSKRPVVPLLYTPPKLLPLIPVYTEWETNSWAQGSSSRANAGLKSAPPEGTQQEKWDSEMHN